MIPAIEGKEVKQEKKRKNNKRSNKEKEVQQAQLKHSSACSEVEPYIH